MSDLLRLIVILLSISGQGFGSLGLIKKKKEYWVISILLQLLALILVWFI